MCIPCCLSEAVLVKRKAVSSCAFWEEYFSVHACEQRLFPFVVESNASADCEVASSKRQEDVLK